MSHMLIVGRTGCRKTHYLLDSLKESSSGVYASIYLVCPTFSINGTWQNWEYRHDRNFHAIETSDVNVAIQNVIKHHSATVKRCPRAEALVILDDVASCRDVKTKSSELVKLGFSGRHLGLSVIVITQQLTSIAKAYREHVSKLVTFYTPGKSDMKEDPEGRPVRAAGDPADPPLRSQGSVPRSATVRAEPRGDLMNGRPIHHQSQTMLRPKRIPAIRGGRVDALERPFYPRMSGKLESFWVYLNTKDRFRAEFEQFAPHEWSQTDPDLSDGDGIEGSEAFRQMCAVYVASHACGVSESDFDRPGVVGGVLRFHVFFTAWRVLRPMSKLSYLLRDRSVIEAVWTAVPTRYRL